jgi:Putative addiction module component
MEEVYYLRIKKSYASAVIEDLKKMDAVELLEEPPIPEWQKKEVRKRLKELKKNPALAIPWDEAMKTIKQL